MSDFRSTTMYFIVVDRFCDGDPGNDLGKNGAQFDPARRDYQKYWGGDLSGIIQKLDYLQKLGIGSVWVTPLFDQIDHVLVDGGTSYAPYHGYWARDFKRIDEHLVDNPQDVRVFRSQDTVFDRLLRDMHGRGMKLVLDVVCNHSSPHVAGGRTVLFDDGVQVASYEQDDGRWFHHAGDVTDWSDLSQVQKCDLASLADFDEESNAYRSYIKTAIAMWLGKGADALRIDTVKHMPQWFWQEFVADMNKAHQGVFMFGEWFMGGVHDADSIEFTRSTGMSIIDFSLRQAIEDALARDSYLGFAQVADVFRLDGRFQTASELVTFVENHDLPRFLSVRNDPARFRLATLLIMIARGIPCIYYGGEQFLHDDTDGGKDPYNRPMMATWDTEGQLFKDIGVLAEVRKRNAAVQKGGTTVRVATPDVLSFSRSYLGSSVLIAMNKGKATTVEVQGAPLVDGDYACVLSGRKFACKAGHVAIELGTNDVVVLEETAAPVTGTTVCEFQLNGYDTRYGEELYLLGDCPELGAWDAAKAVKLEWVNANTWCVDVPFASSCGREIAYKYVVRSGGVIRRENVVPRQRRIPASGGDRFRDDWGDTSGGVRPR